MKKQFEKSFGLVAAAAILALVGMVIYIVTSVTGYLAASSLNMIPIITTVIALVIMLATIAVNKKLSGIVIDITMFVSVGLLLYSFYEFVLGRVSLAADVYFIPVNYPASEASALHISIVGIVLYVIAVIGMIAAAFMRRSDER